ILVLIEKAYFLYEFILYQISFSPYHLKRGKFGITPVIADQAAGDPAVGHVPQQQTYLVTVKDGASGNIYPSRIFNQQTRRTLDTRNLEPRKGTVLTTGDLQAVFGYGASVIVGVGIKYIAAHGNIGAVFQ